MSSDPLVVGIDLGTSGVRVLVADSQGEVWARGSQPLPASAVIRQGNRHEQHPAAWWEAVCSACQQVARGLAGRAGWQQRVAGVCVDGTSGTIVAVDRAGNELRPALMYNDARATEDTELARLPHAALARIAWLQRYEPATWNRAAKFVHQADYLVGRLTDEWSTTDSSNALKTGYDLVRGRWCEQALAVCEQRDVLPRVVSPGSAIGRISTSGGRATGLPAGTPVIAGATDGTAGCVASGARRAGDFNTTLGTTLVYKMLSERFLDDREGAIYCHRLPGGLWLPGAASNVGGAWVEAWFAGEDARMLDERAAGLLPGRSVAYPLVGRGERFPFRRDEARGFLTPETNESAGRFAACLVGTACVERLAYETLERAAGAPGGEVYATGGGSRSDVWMQCRADVTGRVLHRPCVPESAFGSAILAAAATAHGSLSTAIDAMVRIERTFEPNARLRGEYDELYLQFRKALVERGYL